MSVGLHHIVHIIDEQVTELQNVEINQIVGLGPHPEEEDRAEIPFLQKDIADNLFLRILLQQEIIRDPQLLPVS